MKQGRAETVKTRIISATFVMVALAVFKPFGLDALQWQAYVHLIVIWAIGVVVCMLTDLILKYIVHMPHSDEKGVSYLIRRNLVFQVINTPLVALSICFYRHFVLSDAVDSNRLSLVNFLETLVIITFCSFAIGLYWRFKFRSRYLAAELEETRLLNEQLKKMQQPAAPAVAATSIAAYQGHPPVSTQGDGASLADEREDVGVAETTDAPVATSVCLQGTTNESVTLDIANLLYIEAVGNYVKVCWLRDAKVHADMLRATTKQMEEELKGYAMIVRCHRAFLVNLGQVEKIVACSGSMQLSMCHSHESIPVSRSNMAQVKNAIKGV